MTQEQQHPITSPPELVGQWQDKSPETQIADHIQYLAAQAAQWGADMELEACCAWLREFHPGGTEQLRCSRRPKPPSLKEQALEVVTGLEKRCDLQCDLACIRLALEALPND